MEFFAHPWSMAFGGILVSAPILIHLINRMRFKRIRWAAMEFLLKAQKKNRRRMIIEQLILLLLRILLVLLAAFLVARFLYGGAGPKGATHIVVVDDTLSMNDLNTEGGNRTTAFDQARASTAEIAKVASKANAAQLMKVYLQSELNKQPLAEGRVSSTFDETISQGFAIKGNKPTLMAGSTLTTLRKAREFFSDSKNDQTQKVLHLVSDFRDRDWTTGPGAEDLLQEVKDILASGINLSLVDVSAPARNSNIRVTLHHDNLAIVDFKADSRVAIEDADIEFTATVANYGKAASVGTLLKVHINGEEVPGSDQVIEPIPAGEKREYKFPQKFTSRKKGAAVDDKDPPDVREMKRRAEREYHHVRVFFAKSEDNGLNADNVRDLVLEVRKRVPALVVDGNRPELRGDGSDLTHLRAFADASGNYDIEERKLADLEKADLDLYPSIFLVNVGELPDGLIKKLKNYVENGGSLCYFLGEEVKSDHYNTTLFKAGLFPVLLTDRPYDPLHAQGGDLVDPEARKKERERRRQADKKPKILFPQAEHAVTRRINLVSRLFRYLSVNVYWKAQPTATWDPDGKQTQRLIALPNTAGIETYRARATGLMDQARTAVNRLALADADYARWGPLMDDYARQVRNRLAEGDLFFVAEVLEDLLNNQGVKGDLTKPSMSDLWKTSELKALGDDIKTFREQILYGDPLLVAKRQGKGRVVAFLSTAGTIQRRGVGGEDTVQWNDWGVQDACPAPWYVLFLSDLHRYLISEGQAPNRVLGETVDFSVDAKRYEKKVAWTFEPQPDMLVGGPRAEPEKESAEMTVQGAQLAFSLPEAARKRPGVFRFVLTALGDGPADDRQELRAYAYNVDALGESDLKRAATERIEPDPKPTDPKWGKFSLVSGTVPPPSFQEKVPDASESPWLYLFFILILVVEQAMAVHLSYHLKASDNVPAPSNPQPATA